jgi:hypothetical protein
MKLARSVILCFMILGLAAFAAGQSSKPDSKTQDSKSAAPISGSWQCTAHGGPNGDIAFTLDLMQDNDKITGSVSSSLGDTDLNGTFKDGKLEIHIQGGDTNYVLTAKLESGQLSGGEWSNDGGEKGTWDGKKAPDQQ